MKDHSGARQDGGNLIVISDVGELEVHRGTDLVQVFGAAGEEVIEDHDLAGALSQQGPHDGGADEPRASGDDVFTHLFSR